MSPAPAQHPHQQPRNQPGGIASGVVCAFAAVGLLASAASMLFVVPRFIPIFEDFDTELPALTIVLIEWRALIAGLCLLAFAVLVVKEFLVHNPRVKLGINLAMLLLSWIVIPVLIFALFLPLVELMQSVM